MWTVYDHPVDHPEHFVVRRFVVTPDGALPAESVLADTIEQARGSLPPGLYRLPRQGDDHPSVVETWV